MDIFRLPLQLIDFSQQSALRWRVRRIFIGYMLFMYYTYAFMFFFMVAVPEQDMFGMFGSHQQENVTNINSPSDKQATTATSSGNKLLSESDPESATKKKSVPPLILMITFGFIGGVFFITRTFVRTTQRFTDNNVERSDVAVVWYLTRPLQSALMAIFIYYAFRAGQLVFYSMEGAPSEDQINVFTLSLLAIIAGAFSEQAFEKLQAIASNMFKVEKPTD